MREMRRLFLLVNLIFFVSSAAMAGSDTCDRFAQLLQDPKYNVRSVETLLEAMAHSAEFKEHLKTYVLMYKSKSVQPATPAEPRAILFGKDAHLVLTFIGKPQTSGKDAVEAMCWRPEGKRFEFYDLDFSGPSLPAINSSTANPPKCLACHGQNPRPIFEAYNTWPGAFGSVTRVGCSTMQKDKPEFDFYRRYMNQSRWTGRYKFLAAELPEPKTEPSMFGGLSCPPDSDPLTRNFRDSSSYDPSSTFLGLISQLNVQRVAKILKQSPHFPAFRPVLAAVAQGCRDLLEFLPPHVHSSGAKYERTKAELVSSVNTEHSKQTAEFLVNNAADPNFPARAPINSVFGTEGTRDLTDDVATLKYLLDRLQVDFNHPRLSMGFDNGTYHFGTSTRSTNGFFQKAFELALADSDFSLNMRCDSLKEQSLAALSDYKMTSRTDHDKILPLSFNPMSLQERARTFQFLQDKCTSCHGVDQPRLPLNSEFELTSALRNDAFLREKLVNRILGLRLKGRPQMPLGAPFDVETQLSIVHYLNQL